MLLPTVPGIARGADHRHRAREEEGPQRGGDEDARAHAVGAAGQGDGARVEPKVEIVPLAALLGLEPTLAEELLQRLVVDPRQSVQVAHAVLGGEHGEPFE